jgi:hypothetical protein
VRRHARAVVRGTSVCAGGCPGALSAKQRGREERAGGEVGRDRGERRGERGAMWTQLRGIGNSDRVRVRVRVRVTDEGGG